MHSCICKKHVFFHHGDFSGDVTIKNRITGVEIDVPFSELKVLMAGWAQERISHMSNDRVLEIVLKKSKKKKKKVYYCDDKDICDGCYYLDMDSVPDRRLCVYDKECLYKIYKK